jgi:hypothetical protein
MALDRASEIRVNTASQVYNWSMNWNRLKWLKFLSIEKDNMYKAPLLCMRGSKSERAQLEAK